MKTYKYLKLFIVTILVVSLMIVGCQNDSKDTINKESIVEESSTGKTVNKTGFPIVEDKVSYKLAAFQAQTWGEFSEMKFFKDLENKTNVHIEWEALPANNAKEKLGLMFAGGDLPDAFYGATLSKNDESTYGAEGLILPLENLVDKYAPNISQALKKYPDAKKLCKSTDGHLYSLPEINVLAKQQNENTSHLVINKTWLDKLGLEIPTTTKEFYNVLQKFKTEDPNGNNKSDEIPFSYGPIYGYKHLMGSFGIVDLGGNCMINNGNIEFIGNKPEYKEAVKYFSELYQEKLTDQEVFTHDDKRFAAKGSKKPPVYGAFVEWVGYNTVGMDTLKKDYVPVPPLKGPEGKQLWPKSFAGYYSSRFQITSECKNPEILLRWADLFYNKDGKIKVQGMYGPFGINLKETDDGKIDFLPTPEGMQYGAFRGQETIPMCMGLISEEIADKIVPNENTKMKMEFDKVYKDFLIEESYPPVDYTTEEMQELSILDTDINQYMKNIEARWIVGEVSIDDSWDKHLEQLEKMGLSRWLKIKQNALDRYNSK